MNIEGILKPLGLPIAYRRFKQYKSKPLPSPPYIVWFIDDEALRGSDSKNHIVERHIIVEFYSAKKDFKIEAEIERLLDFAFLDKSEEYDGSQGVFIVSYEFDVIEKIREK